MSRSPKWYSQDRRPGPDSRGRQHPELDRVGIMRSVPNRQDPEPVRTYEEAGVVVRVFAQGTSGQPVTRPDWMHRMKALDDWQRQQYVPQGQED